MFKYYISIFLDFKLFLLINLASFILQDIYELLNLISLEKIEIQQKW